MINSSLIAEFDESYPKDYPEPESVVHVLKLHKKVKEIPVIYFYIRDMSMPLREHVFVKL